MRKLRIFGLALIALVAVSAIGATMASADELTATKYPATTIGSNEKEVFTDEFTTTAGTVKCTTASYKGTLKEKSTTLTVAPTYSGCTGFGFPATVTTTGCNYLFHVNGTTSTVGTVDLVCEAGKEITVVAKSGETVKCTVHVGSQAGLGTVTYSSIGAAGETEEVTAFADLSGVKYTHTPGTGVGACVNGSGTGTLKAKATLTGLEDEGVNHIGLILSNS